MEILGSPNQRDSATEQKTERIGLPGGSVVKNPPTMQVTGSISGPGGSHMERDN